MKKRRFSGSIFQFLRGEERLPREGNVAATGGGSFWALQPGKHSKAAIVGSSGSRQTQQTGQLTFMFFQQCTAVRQGGEESKEV